MSEIHPRQNDNGQPVKMSGLSEESKTILTELLERPDVQWKPGLKKGLENLLTGRKPKPRVPGKVNEAAMPAGFKKST